mmetsp:Transcript_14950/g.38408  ORF Transcript_14950/g.38408 Transcript_14950/m.38408 type:complete len:223 (-) Transcript_14950:902-1570(-)
MPSGAWLWPCSPQSWRWGCGGPGRARGWPSTGAQSWQRRQHSRSPSAGPPWAGTLRASRCGSGQRCGGCPCPDGAASSEASASWCSAGSRSGPRPKGRRARSCRGRSPGGLEQRGVQRAEPGPGERRSRSSGLRTSGPWQEAGRCTACCCPGSSQRSRSGTSAAAGLLTLPAWHRWAPSAQGRALPGCGRRPTGQPDSSACHRRRSSRARMASRLRAQGTRV